VSTTFSSHPYMHLRRCIATATRDLRENVFENET
jgi:hypothetical protein